ncbi:MAG: peptidoglycan-binding protein, partial [Pseudomonadota bacterium]
GGVLTTPSLTFGRLADIRGLNGEPEIKRLALLAQEGDAGGPVFDNGGAVLGMLLPRITRSGQQLPDEVNFSAAAMDIVASLDTAGINVQTTDTVAFLPAQALSDRATDMTVLVSCW